MPGISKKLSSFFYNFISTTCYSQIIEFYNFPRFGVLLLPVKMLATSEAKLDGFSSPKCYTGQMQHTLSKEDLATGVLSWYFYTSKGLWLVGDLHRLRNVGINEHPSVKARNHLTTCATQWDSSEQLCYKYIHRWIFYSSCPCLSLRTNFFICMYATTTEQNGA